MKEGAESGPSALLAHTSDAIIALRGPVVVAWNPRAAALFGWAEHDAVGRTITELLGSADDADAWDRFLLTINGATPDGMSIAEVRLARRDGGTAVVDGVVWTDDDAGGRVLLLRDRAPATELQRERQQLADEAARLWHHVFHDPLTNLANRKLFQQRAEELLDRRGDRRSATLLLDLDRFNAVNDALGHAVGDRLLVQVAERLRSCAGDANTVARQGGDEFAVLVHDVSGEDDAVNLAVEIIDALRDPFDVDGRLLTVSTSIGIVTIQGGLGDVDSLLRDADVALHEAKLRGRGSYACFEATMHHAAVERLELEADLRRAVERGELSLHYQPIAGIRSGTVHCVEALARWTHPTRGDVPPAEFIAVAEATGLIVGLGDWILREACHQVRDWHRRYPDVPPVAVAVNLSGLQLQLPRFGQTVADVLAETGLAADLLVLEMTESQVMENVGPILSNLRRLQSLGVRLSIDDFGTGYSSLARLRSLPVDELKIDRAFVQETDASGREGPLVAAIVAMAHTLELRVVGEGVETADQLEALLRAGCDGVQGFLLGRPAPPQTVEPLVSQPMLVLRLAAAATALGETDRLDVDVIEALGAVLGHAEDRDRLVAGILDLVARVTGLDSIYATRIDWAREELQVTHVRGECGLAAGNTFSWSGSETPDLYADARLVRSRGLETYVSVPIVGRRGGLHGTLCAASRRHHVLTRTQLGALEALARILGEQLRPSDPSRPPNLARDAPTAGGGR